MGQSSLPVIEIEEGNTKQSNATRKAQRSKKGATRPLAKLLIHHDSWAARWAFLNQMVLEPDAAKMKRLMTIYFPGLQAA